MAINATDAGGSNIPVIEAGTYPARCIQIVHIGTIEDEYKGKKMTPNKVRLAWELPTELYEFDEAKGPEPRIISKEYTLSLGDKANLRKDLDAWRGKPFTEIELKGFDVSTIIGAPCQLSIANGVGVSSGKPYAKVSAVAKLMKGIKVADQVLESVIFMYDLEPNELLKAFESVPTYVQDKIVTTPEWAALGIERPIDKNAQPASEGTTPKDEVSEAVAAAEADEDKPPF